MASTPDPWDRLLAGEHTAVLGGVLPPPPEHSSVEVIRLACDVHSSLYGLAIEVFRHVEVQLGAEGGIGSALGGKLLTGLRRKLLDELSDRERGGVFVEVLNRLGEQTHRQYVLCFEAVECGDAATRHFLRDLITHPGWLRLPLALTFSSREPDGPSAALVEALGKVDAKAVITLAEAPEPATVVLPDLPPEVLRVVRAAAVIGKGFSAPLVGALLDLEPLDVLEYMQWAHDLGVPVQDLGDGHFRLPASMVDRLKAGLIPSLVQAWHMRLGELLSAQEEQETEPTFEQLPPPPPRVTGRIDTGRLLRGEMPEEAPDASPASDRPTSRIPFKDLLKASAEELAACSHEGVDADFISSLLEAAHRDEDAPKPAEEPIAGLHGNDAGKAASHYAAAGDIDQSAERYYTAARQASLLGAAEAALAYCKKGLELLDGRPPSASRRLLRVRLLAELGRVQWRAAGFEAAFTLPEALSSLSDAAGLLHEDDPADLRVEVATLTANVCYEMGDPSSLERALRELTSASRMLLEVSDPTGAARLLNDQAAVWVRLGDPVQAAYLLEKSREVFEARSQSDPVTLVELAETHHLLARLPLHVKAKAGKEQDAMSIGYEHAAQAASNYRSLQAERELARVWETMARLKLRLGDPEEASERLRAAAQVQQGVGDVLGLARTTAALAEVLSAIGQHREALELLGDSVTLNMEKGSPLGLAYNRHGFESLAAVIPEEQRGELGELLTGIATRLEDAEGRIGRVSLPATG